MKGFLERHRQILTVRWCENIKRSRASVTPDVIKSYFDELEISLNGVEPHLIINYDETNISDDPGKSKVIVKRGTKHAHRIVDSSKSSHSVMFAGTASGVVLSIYVVYRSEHLYTTWTSGGPPQVRYNRSKSGWFTED